jgi:hypothetical protein
MGEAKENKNKEAKEEAMKDSSSLGYWDIEYICYFFSLWLYVFNTSYISE